MTRRAADAGTARLALLALGLCIYPWAPPKAVAEPACVLRADLDGVVHAAAADYLKRAVSAVEGGSCSALLVVIDTPGGALDATRTIAQTFLEARVPIIAFVHPGGAQAGSAGLFITAAAHVAAMAPGTNIGAAHPVSATGADPEKAGGDHMARKIENDAAAFARAIGERRERNVEWLEKAVVESASATAREAKSLNVIDLVVPTVNELLTAVDGRTVTAMDRTLTLRTADAEAIPFEPTIRERVLSVIAHPNVAYLLLMAGMLGLMIELYNPGGTIVAGAVGVFCLLLAGMGLNLLPVRLGAVVLIVAGVALFVAEMHITSFGLLALGGAASLLLGSALLIDQTRPEFFSEPSFGVSWGVVVPMVLVLAAVAGGLAVQAARFRGKPSYTGSAGMEGTVGRAATAVGPSEGWVQIHGERWRARADQPLAEGTAVRVVAVEGLTLQVVPEETQNGGAAVV